MVLWRRSSVSIAKCVVVGLCFGCLYIVIVTSRSSSSDTSILQRHRRQDLIGTLTIQKTEPRVLLEQISPPGIIVKAHDGLGNQLFNYASSFALAKKFKIPLYIYSFANDSSEFKSDRSNSLTNPMKRKFMLDFFHFPMGNWVAQNSWKPKDLKTFNCEDLLYNKISQKDVETKFLMNSDYCHCGIFFENVSQEIKSNLVPVLEEESDAFVYWKAVLNQVDSQEETTSVAIHIRRGDYVKRKNWITPISYFRSAMQLMKQKLSNKKIVFFVFTDDAKYVKENFLNSEDPSMSNEEIHFVSATHGETTNLEQFILISMCKHKIISNSTFSWWAAYLSIQREDTVIIAPTYHPKFLDHVKDKHQRDFKNYVLKYKYPSDWIRIDPYNGTGLGQ